MSHSLKGFVPMLVSSFFSTSLFRVLIMLISILASRVVASSRVSYFVHERKLTPFTQGLMQSDLQVTLAERRVAVLLTFPYSESNWI